MLDFNLIDIEMLDLYLTGSEHLTPVYKNGFCVNDEVESLLNAFISMF